MWNPRSLTISVAAWLLSSSVSAQEPTRPLTKRFIVKTNVLSWIAQRPTLTFEKVFRRNVSIETSFVQGAFHPFFFTDHYDYTGFLLKGKKYFFKPDFGEVSPYAALYAGTLKRNMHTEGQSIGSGGFLGYRSRNFSAGSIRSGGSLGACYFTKSKIVIDGLISLGYGKYTKVYKSEPGTNVSGYLDAQLWLSVGYCF